MQQLHKEEEQEEVSHSGERQDKIIDEEVPDSLNVFQLRVPDPDPGDEEENEESKEANKWGITK